MSIKPTITLGIPAYNEGANISNLLAEVLNQTNDTYTLIEILVISDGSTDSTADDVRSFDDKRIRLIETKERAGKAKNLNYLFQHAAGDFLVLLDADISLSTNDTISKLLSSMISDSTIGLTGGNTLPLPPRTFIEKCVHLTVIYMDRLRTLHHGGDNAYGAVGCIMAVSKSFRERLIIPEKMITTDQFMYFSCRKMNYKFKHERSALVGYRMPSTLRDQIKQNTRYLASKQVMTSYFGDLVEEEYDVPFTLSVRLKLGLLISNPIHAITIRILNLYCTIRAKKTVQEIDGKWLISDSTKSLS